jgi:hypothetical protein
VRPPFSPESVVREFAEVLKRYRISRVVGDRYAGEWSRERFRLNEIEYSTSERTKSDLYQSLLPLVNSGRCELLDNPPSLGRSAILSVARRAPAGTRSITPGQHDDIANSAAGALVLASVVKKPTSFVTPEIIYGGSGAYFRAITTGSRELRHGRRRRVGTTRRMAPGQRPNFLKEMPMIREFRTDDGAIIRVEFIKPGDTETEAKERRTEHVKRVVSAVLGGNGARFHADPSSPLHQPPGGWPNPTNREQRKT